MEEFEKQLKKHVNQSLPTSVDDRIIQTLQSLPRKKRVPKLFIGLSAAVILFALSFSVSFVSPTFAETLKSLPVIGSAFEIAGNIGIKTGNEQGLTTLLGEQIEWNGKKITFTESLYDGAEIHVGYIVESYQPESPDDFLSEIEFTINKKTVGSYGMGARGKEIENGSYVGVMSIRMQNDIPDEFLLGIQPRTRKVWSVELPVVRKGDHQSFLVNEAKEIDDLTILYDKVTFFPTSTEIAIRQVIDEQSFYDDKYMYLDFQIFDDMGRVLQPFGSGGGGGGVKDGKVLHTFNYNFEPIESLPGSLTIKPYLRDIHENPPAIVKEKWEGTALTLAQGDIGDITILEQKQEHGKTTFIYEVEGENTYEQATAFWLEDADGNRFDWDDPPVRIEGEMNRYTATFSTIPHTQMYICTVKQLVPNYLEEMEITIDLKPL